MAEAGAKGVVIGLSGGIDSSVIATIAVRALGSKNVYTLFLPSNTTPDTDLNHVKSLCSRLKLEIKVINIQKMIGILAGEMQKEEESSLLEWMNLKPRIRQAILCNYRYNIHANYHDNIFMV